MDSGRGTIQAFGNAVKRGFRFVTGCSCLLVLFTEISMAQRIDRHPQSFSTCTDGPSRELSVGVSGSGNITYQWQRKRGTGSWEDISGATGNAYTPGTGEPGTTFYRVRVTENNGKPVFSQAANVTVVDPPGFGFTAPSSAVCLEEAVRIRVDVDENLWEIAWESSADGQDWQEYGSVQAAIQPATDTAGTTYYRVKATPKGLIDPVCFPVSDPVELSVEDCMELEVLKTASAPDAFTGGELSYQIRITNHGPSPLLPEQTLTVLDEIPEGFTVQSVDAPGNFNLENGTWTGITIQPWESETLTINGTVNHDYTSSSLVNSVNILPPSGVRNTADEEDLESTVTTKITRNADLQVTKAPSVQTGISGTELSYTIEVTNTGPAVILEGEAFNLEESLPEGFIVRNYRASEGDYNYMTGNWTGVELPPGKTVTLTVYGSIAPGFSLDELSNTVTLRPPRNVTDPYTGNNQAAVSLPVSRESELRVSKEGPFSDEPLYRHQQVSYTLRVNNDGPSDADSVYIWDEVPPEVVVESWRASASGGAVILEGESGNSQRIDVLAGLPAGEWVNITITGTVAADAPPGTILNTGYAGLEPGDPGAGSDGHENIIQVGEFLILQKEGPLSAVAGREIRYTVQLINSGDETLNGISFTDWTEPAGILSDISWEAEADPGVNLVPREGDGLLAFSADIPPGEKIVLTVTGTIHTDFEGRLINLVRAESSGGSAVDQASTRVSRRTDLAVSKSGPATVNAREEISYTVSVRNQGAFNADQVVVTDRLPVGTGFVSASDGGIYRESTHSVTWPELPSLSPGELAEYTLTLIAPPEKDSIPNTVTVSSQNAPVRHDTVITGVRGRSDLEVRKTAPDSVYEEEELTYAVTVRNNGPSVAEEIRVRDRLPEGIEIIDPGEGTVNGGEISWDIPSLGLYESVTFQIRVRAPAGAGTLINRVLAASETYDPEESNDNAETRTVILPVADLEVRKTGPDSAYTGETFEYEVTVTNHGRAAAEAVQVTDILPPQVGFVSAEPEAAARSGRRLTWEVPVLKAGESRTFTVQVRSGTSVQTIRNNARVNAETHDRNPDNNTARFDTEIYPGADVEAVKTGPEAVAPGETIVYELLVQNNGLFTALEVGTEDLLPGSGQVAEIVHISGGGAYSPQDRVIRWDTVSVLRRGTARLYTIEIRPAPAYHEYLIRNQASSGSGETFDPDSANNQTVWETLVQPEPDIAFELPIEQICYEVDPVPLSGGSLRNRVTGTETYTGQGVEDGIFYPGRAGPGTHVITYTFTPLAGPEVSLQDSLTVLPPIHADAGPDKEILQGDSVLLEGEASGLEIYWSPAEGLADPAAPRTKASPESTTTYMLRADNAGLCEAQDEMTVFVYPRIQVPNAFSPNQDGTNDTWELAGIDAYPDAEVKIFNRYGDMIFFSRGYGQEWDGRYQNRDLPPATYYYVIEPRRGVLPPFSGSVTILR